MTAPVLRAVHPRRPMARAWNPKPRMDGVHREVVARRLSERDEDRMQREAEHLLDRGLMVMVEDRGAFVLLSSRERGLGPWVPEMWVVV